MQSYVTDDKIYRPEVKVKPLVIRRAAPDDRERIWLVHTGAVRRLCRGHYSPRDIEAWVGPLTPESYRESMKSRMFLVAEEGGVVLGFGALNVEAAEVEAVYVDPDHARRGIGARLLRALEAAARASGLTRLNLSASLNSVPFYERAGYEAREQATHRVRSGAEIACVRMARVL